MVRVLITPGDDAALAVGAELRRRGHDVRVLGPVERYPDVAAAGLGFAVHQHTPTAPPPAPDLTGRQRLARDAALALDPRPGLDVAAELGRRRPDLLLVDARSLAALRTALRSGLPTAVLAPTLHRHLVREWARGPVGLAGAVRRLRPVTLWNAAARLLVAADAGLDDGAPPAPNVVRVGPVLAATRPPAREPDPFALVSGVPAPDGLDVPVVVDGPDVDRADVLARAHLFVGAGDHGPTMRALANDLPVVLVPGTPEQRAVAAAVEAAGAGRVAEACEVAAAVRAQLAPGPHHAAAAALGARLRAAGGARAAADELEALVRA
jgi:hypothetical protein